MTVGTEQIEIVGVIISPITIFMVKFYRNITMNRVNLIPSALGALIAKLLSNQTLQHSLLYALVFS